VCVGLLSVVGAVQLFRLRKSAVPAFSTALAARGESPARLLQSTLHIESPAV
jgi:hypothetical protein